LSSNLQANLKIKSSYTLLVFRLLEPFLLYLCRLKHFFIDIFSSYHYNLLDIIFVCSNILPIIIIYRAILDLLAICVNKCKLYRLINTSHEIDWWKVNKIINVIYDRDFAYHATTCDHILFIYHICMCIIIIHTVVANWYVHVIP